MKKLFIAIALILLIAVNVNAQTGGNLMNIIPAADCSWLTFDGFLCQDTDDHKLYKWNGVTQIELAGGADAASLQGYAVGATAPTSTYVLTWDGDSWEPAPAPGAGTGAATTLGYITWQTEASLSAERVLTESTGIDLSTAVANQIIVSVNTTEIGTTTWGSGGASYLWTYNISGTTDPVLTVSDGVFNISAGVLQQEGAKVALGTTTPTDNTVPRWDSSGTLVGQRLQNSSVVIDDSNNMSGVAELTTSGQINDVTITDPGTGATLTLADGSSLITVGGYAVTLTATTATGVTFPSTGTLYGTASGSITSAQLAASLTNETGTTLAVFSDSPTFTDDITLGAAGVKLGGATGILTLTGVGGTYNENLVIDFEPATDTQTIDISSGTLVTTIDFGSLILGVGGLDLSDANITNVGNIALDSISNDGTSITIIASDAGTVTVENVVFTSGALTGVTSISDGTASWSSIALSGFSTIANTGNITTGGDLIAADGNTDFIIQSDNEVSDTVKIQVRDTTDAGAWDDILVATSGADPTLALTADGAISVVSSGSTVTVESVVFTGGAISSATTIAMGGALSGVTTATLTHTAPDITLTDSDNAAGTGNLLFASANVQDVVGTIQADIAGSATTFLSIDGVNEEVLFGKKADLATLGIENVGALAGVTTITATGDVSITDAVNDGNPVFAIGSGASERLSITATYEAGGQLLESVTFATVTEDTDADDGEMIFSVDGTTIMTIKDGGVSFVGDVLLPSTNADPAAVAGALRHDSTVSNFTNGALVYYNGAAIKQVVDMTTATASACTEAQVIVYDATADLWKCADAPAADADIVAIAALTVAEGKIIIGSAAPAWSLSAYALPIVACTEGQILKTAAGGNFICGADADTGGATAWNAIGDAAGVGSIDFVTYQQTITGQLNSAGSMLTMTNTVADLTADVSFIDMKYTDDGDANGFFMRGYDNATDLKWSIAADGAATFGSGAFTSITASTTIELEGLLTAGTSHTVLTDAAGKINSAALNTVGIGQGGTGATAAATTNGIVYGASATAYGLTAAATVEGQILRAGASPFVPAWSTATYPLTATTNGIMFAASATGFSQITVVNSGVLVTSAGGVPSIATTLPAVTLTTPNIGAATGDSLVLTGDATFTGGDLVLGKNTTTAGTVKFFGGTSGSITLTPTAIAGTTVLTLPATTGTLAKLENKISDLAAVTSAELLAKVSDETGSASGTPLLVFNQAPTLVAPALGAATATSINDVTITDPGAGAILTLANTSTLTTVGGYALTLTATTASNVTFPSSGTLLNNTLTSAYLLVGNVSNVATGVAITGDITITNAGVTAIGADKVNATHIDWGAGANQIDLDDIPDSATYHRVVAGDLDTDGHPIRLYDSDSSTYVTITGLATTARVLTVQDVAGQTLANLGTAQTFSASNTFTPVQYFGGAAAAGSLRIYDGTDNYVTLNYPTSSVNTTFSFPLVAGTNGYFLQTDGSGNTSWSVTGIVTAAGDCAGGACLDGTSDGGTYIRLYDGTSAYESITGGVRLFTFASSTALSENLILTLGANDNTITLSSGTSAATLNLNAFSVSSNGLLPDAAGGADIGSASAEWQDLYLGNSAVIKGQLDQSATLTSSASTWTASAFTVTGALAANGSLTVADGQTSTFNGNTIVGNADTDTLTIRSLLVGGDRTGINDAIQIAATVATATYATTSNDLYVARNVEVVGTVYAAAFNGGTGTDGARGITLTSNTALTPTADQIYFIGDALHYSEAGTEKHPMKLEDSQTATGLKIFEAGIYLGDTDTAGVFKIADGSTNYWVIASPAIAADMTLTLPTDAGATGKYLKTTTTANSAVLSWDTPTAAADTTGGTGGVQYNAAGVLSSDAGFVFTTATDKLTLGSSGGATTGSLQLFYTGTTYSATIQPNASMSGTGVTITLPPSTSTLIGTGDNTFVGYQKLKVGTIGVGGAPLYFQTGTNLTSAAAGAMEFDGTYLYFSPSTTRYSIPLALAVAPLNFTTGGTTARTITLPDAAITVARIDAGQTFAGAQILSGVNAAGGSLDSLTLSGTLGIFDGSDTFRGIYLNYTDANHTGTGNTIALVDTAAITGDANSNLYGIRIGNLTGTTGAAGEVENAIKIGTGWDIDLELMDNTATITHSGTTSLTIASTSGTVIVEGITFTGDAITGAASLVSTKVNDVTISDPGTGATLTLADGSSLITSGAYALTLTATTASNATFPAGSTTLAANNQTMYIGSTQVAINRATNPLTLADITLTAPVLGSATATQILATGIVDGTAPVTITATSAGTAIGATYKSGYIVTNPTSASGPFIMTLPTAAEGLQYCPFNGAAKTGSLTVYTALAPTGTQYIDLDGVLTANTGGVQFAAAAGNFGCFIGVDATHWKALPTKGTATRVTR